MSVPSTHETARKSVHIASLAFALLLRWLTPWQAIAFGVGAVGFNVLVLPHVGRALFRHAERPGSLTGGGGIIIYPVAVLLLVSVVGAWMGRMDIAAGAWAAMALGDGVATLAGRALGGPRLPWNRAKSWSGVIGFVVAGSSGIAFFTQWVGGWNAWVPAPVPLALAAAVAAVAAAWVETLELPVDDNWRVPAVASVVLSCAAAWEPSRAMAALDAHAWRNGVVIAGVLGWVAFAARAVSVSGLLGGIALGAATWGASGGWAFATLATFFVLASVATRIGGRRKAARGVAQGDGGRRSARHAWANGGAGLVCALMALGVDPAHAVAWRIAAAAAYATAAVTTVATEIGQWLGGPTLSLRTWRPAPPGTPGAIGIAGTLAGAVAAALVGAIAVACGAMPPHALPWVVAGAVGGSFLESVCGARVAPAWRTPLVHDALNALNTCAGAALAGALAAWSVR